MTGLRDLCANYDAFIFDLWGVVHNGVSLYPEVRSVFANLQAAGKKIGLLSNSPRPVADAKRNLQAKFALTPQDYDILMTSGQMAYDWLRDRPDPALKSLGRRFWPIGTDEQIAPFLAPELALEIAAAPKDADFILVAGLSAGHDTLEDYEQDLELWKQLNLPLFCANPDHHVIRGETFGLAGGAIANAYRSLGGKVRDDCGKPHKPIFNRILRELDLPAAHCLMVGDNLATDIPGAAMVGMPSLWLTGGVHGPELKATRMTEPSQWRDFALRHGQKPVHILPEVGW
jgi:HAD superfamily hydrolase (TIGR01459 family)